MMDGMEILPANGPANSITRGMWSSMSWEAAGQERSALQAKFQRRLPDTPASPPTNYSLGVFAIPKDIPTIEKRLKHFVTNRRDPGLFVHKLIPSPSSSLGPCISFITEIQTRRIIRLI